MLLVVEEGCQVEPSEKQHHRPIGWAIVGQGSAPRALLQGRLLLRGPPGRARGDMPPLSHPSSLPPAPAPLVAGDPGTRSGSSSESVEPLHSTRPRGLFKYRHASLKAAALRRYQA